MTIYFKLVVFPDITHTTANNGRKSVILNLLELIFFRAYPSLNLYILFHNSLATCHGFPDITHIKVNNGCKSAISNFID